MQTHLTLRSLDPPWSDGSRVPALFAVKPKSKAVIFIHGFGGDPLTTWAQFHTMLPALDAFAGVDIFSWGFDGKYGELIASAALFREFLHRLFTETATLLNQNLPDDAQRGAASEYEHCLIVCHSLGAVISRRALVDATAMDCAWTQKTSMVLFAPAHMGANVQRLALEMVSSIPFLKFFAPVARFQSPLLDQLQPDSPELRALQVDVARATAGNGNQHLIPRKVVIAQYDRVVSNVSFPGDPPAMAFAGKDHGSVCKPNAAFPTPIEVVRACL